jgi:hypothetical protein
MTITSPPYARTRLNNSVRMPPPASTFCAPSHTLPFLISSFPLYFPPSAFTNARQHPPLIFNSKCSIRIPRTFTSPPTLRKTTPFRRQIPNFTNISLQRPPLHPLTHLKTWHLTFFDSLNCKVCKTDKPVQAFSKTQLLKSAPSGIPPKHPDPIPAPFVVAGSDW